MNTQLQVIPADNAPPGGQAMPGTDPRLARPFTRSRRNARAASKSYWNYRPRPPGTLPALLLGHLRRRYAACDYQRRIEALRACVARALPVLASLDVRLRAPADDALAMGGHTLLTSWRTLFLDGDPATVPLRQCRSFLRRAGQVLASSRRLRDALPQFEALVHDVRLLLQQGAGGAGELQAAGALAEQLLEWGDALCDDEMSDEVLLRVQQYPQLQKELAQNEQEQRRRDLGTDSLLALGEIDLHRLDWTGGQRCALLKALSRLGDARAMLA